MKKLFDALAASNRRKRMQKSREQMKQLGLIRKSEFEQKISATATPQIGLDEEFSNRQFRFIAVDVETANPDESTICQIGLAGVTHDGQIMTTSTLINPCDDFDPAFVRIHGISEQTITNAPTFYQAHETLQKCLEGQQLIQHSKFDERALNSACQANAIPNIQADWADSVLIARRAWPEFKNNGGHGLANLKINLGLDFQHHHAEEDARAAAQIVLLAEKKTGMPYGSILTKPNGRNKKQSFPPSVKADGNPNGPLHGHTACFTGQLSMSRTEAATVAANAGITIKASVTKKTTLLIVGDQDISALAGHTKSTKHRRADELIALGQNIRIIGETDFLNMLNET